MGNSSVLVGGYQRCRRRGVESSGDWTQQSRTASWRKWPFSWVATSGWGCREWQGKGNPGRKSSRSKSRRAQKGLGVRGKWEVAAPRAAMRHRNQRR